MTRKAILGAAVACALSGCTTSSVTGAKKVLGVFKVPFTGSAESAELTSKQIMIIEQLAPFQYVALVLIVGGACMWYFTGGSTKGGKFFVGLGLGLSTFAVVMPRISGWVGLAALAGLVAIVAFQVYHHASRKRIAMRS